MYIITNPEIEDPLDLPSGDLDVPLVIQDKNLDANGDLIFTTGDVPTIHPFWTPGTSGNYITVNGKVQRSF